MKKSGSYFGIDNTKNGQATITLTLLIGGTAILIGITLAFLTISFINASSAYQAGSRAFVVASAGAQDALLRLIRDKDFMGTGGSTTTITVGGNDTAIVNVSPPISSQVVITSQSTILGTTRKLEVITVVDSLTGKVSVLSWKQLIIQ